MKKLKDCIDWIFAGIAVLIPATVFGVSEALTVGDLLPLVPLYVIAWRMPEARAIEAKVTRVHAERLAERLTKEPKP